MNKENKKLRKTADEMKANIIEIIMPICAVDGKISIEEKNWIKQLIK